MHSGSALAASGDTFHSVIESQQAGFLAGLYSYMYVHAQLGAVNNVTWEPTTKMNIIIIYMYYLVGGL